MPRDGTGGRRADPEVARGRQISGSVDIASQARPRAGQFDRARSAVPRARIRPELRIEHASESAECRGTGCRPVGDKAAPMVACSSNRLGQLLRLQRRQITLQHNDIGE